MPFVQANGIRIGYEIVGSGAPLLLIAGLGYDRWMWHKMVPGLARHFRVITYDNRGVGETDKPAGPYTAELLADDAAALLTALGIERAAVMGHSMGGFVAQAFALQYPQRLTHLILSATNFGGPNHVPVTPEALAVLMDMSGDPMQRLRRGIEVSTAPGFAAAQPELLAEWLAYRAAHPLHLAGYQAQLAIGLRLATEAAAFEGRLPQVRTPTLILFGAADKVVPPANAGLLAAQIPDSRVEILAGAGHFFPLEMPAAANAAIIAFLR
ncbi:MAG: alpha/beta hydrolase [Candidatus Promineifilaceae bacterium]